MRPADPYIDVQVCHVGIPEPREVVFHPLRAADKPIFFGVPACENDGAKRFPTFGQRLAVTADDLVENGGAAIGVAGAADNPGIPMITDYNNLVGEGTIDNAEDVPDRGRGVVLLVVQVEDEVVGAWADVILDALVAKT